MGKKIKNSFSAKLKTKFKESRAIKKPNVNNKTIELQSEDVIFVPKPTAKAENKPIASNNSKKSKKSKGNKKNLNEPSVSGTTKNINKRGRNNDFIETNNDDEAETAAVKTKLQKKKAKIELALGIDPTLPRETIVIHSDDDEKRENGPKVPVHKVSVEQMSSSNSDDDSYIDHFFNDKEDKEFDENRVFSSEEIEQKSDFLSAASETEDSESVSDDHSDISENKQMEYYSQPSANESDNDSGEEESDDLSDFSVDSDDSSDDSSCMYMETSSEGSEDDSIGSFSERDTDELTPEEEWHPEPERRRHDSEESGSTYDDFMNGYSEDDSNDSDYTSEYEPRLKKKLLSIYFKHRVFSIISY